MIETNFKKLGARLDAIGIRMQKRAAKYDTEVGKTFGEFGRRVRNSIVHSMRMEPKTGILYKYKKGKYRASAPGESPAVRSSKLVRALAYTARKTRVEIGVLKRVNYGKYLEPDTAAGLRNRPFLKVNIDKHVPYAKSQIMKSIFSIEKGRGFS